MVARCRVLLLEAGLVLLVDDDQTEPLKGKEDGTARTENHVVGMAGQLPLPYLYPFGIAVPAVVDAQTVAEYALQPLRQLHRQRNLGHEIEHLPVLVYRLLNKVNVDFGLPRRRYAVQKRNWVVHHLYENLIVGIGLRLAERLDIPGARLATVVDPPHLAVDTQEDTLVHERADGSHRAVRGIEERVVAYLADRFPLMPQDWFASVSAESAALGTSSACPLMGTSASLSTPQSCR